MTLIRDFDPSSRIFPSGVICGKQQLQCIDRMATRTVMTLAQASTDCFAARHG